MLLDNLTPEQIEKAKACKSTDELVALAKAEGVELTDVLLEKISGGNVWDDSSFKEANCQGCGKRVTWTGGSERPVMCPYCGRRFNWE